MGEASKARQVADDAWMGLNPAAQALGTTRYKVLAHIVAGELQAKREAGRDLVTRDSVMTLKRKIKKSA